MFISCCCFFPSKQLVDRSVCLNFSSHVRNKLYFFDNFWALYFVLFWFLWFEWLSIFKSFLNIVFFFPKKPTFEYVTCQMLDSFIFNSPTLFNFQILKKKRIFYWSMESAIKENFGNSKFTLCNQKTTSI